MSHFVVVVVVKSEKVINPKEIGYWVLLLSFEKVNNTEKIGYWVSVLLDMLYRCKKTGSSP